jgi:hypothetical protein
MGTLHGCLVSLCYLQLHGDVCPSGHPSDTLQRTKQAGASPWPGAQFADTGIRCLHHSTGTGTSCCMLVLNRVFYVYKFHPVRFTVCYLMYPLCTHVVCAMQQIEHYRHPRTSVTMHISHDWYHTTPPCSIRRIGHSHFYGFTSCYCVMHHLLMCAVRVLTVSSDGLLTCWAVSGSGAVSFAKGPLFRRALDVDVQSVTMDRSNMLLNILANNGKVVMVHHLLRCATKGFDKCVTALLFSLPARTLAHACRSLCEQHMLHMYMYIIEEVL